jgi:hypothetical protein
VGGDRGRVECLCTDGYASPWPCAIQTREFLEAAGEEELCQAGVEVDEKDYFSVIISSIPVSLQLCIESTRRDSVLLSKNDPNRLAIHAPRGIRSSTHSISALSRCLEGEALAVDHAPKSKEKGKERKHADFT